jgi:FkbM family methyltransferase
LVLFGDVIDPELVLVQRALPPGGVAVDAGAAIGQFTVVAGRVPGVVIHAFEPSSANVDSLLRNVDLNGLRDRVIVHQAALAADDGSAVFRTTANTFLSALEIQSYRTLDARDSEVVPVRRLDDEADRLGLVHLDVLKVNVAGFEGDVLEGAMGLFRHGRVGMLIVLIGTAVMPALKQIAHEGYLFFFYDPFASVLHEVSTLDVASLNSPPTPARHVIALHPSALQTGALSRIPRVRQYCDDPARR